MGGVEEDVGVARVEAVDDVDDVVAYGGVFAWSAEGLREGDDLLVDCSDFAVDEGGARFGVLVDQRRSGQED